MANFEELLKRSLSIVSEGYLQAKRELEEVVGRLRDSINTIAGNQFALEIREVGADPAGTSYRVGLDTDTDDARAKVVRLMDFYIPSKGYPIKLGQYSRATENFHFNGEVLSNKADLENFFASQLNDPDSALIQAIGFALRQKENPSDPF